ncbi:MAG TPA: SpoIIE family protein phosphatase [Rhodothermales bacterium]|nr:SpoIIE family protein phosphatase [Rhodothermales bacterium]
MASVPLSPPAPLRERIDLGALIEASKIVADALDVEFLLNHLLLAAMSKALTTRAAVLLADDAGAFRVAAHRGIAGLETGTALLETGLDADTGLLDEEVPEVLRAHRLTLVLPIRVGMRDVGLLTLGPRLTREPYSDDLLRFLRSLVSMTAPALQNARTVEALREANRRLDGHVQRLETLFELSKAFAATTDRAAIARLLGFSLMGQTTAARHAFLAEPPGSNGLILLSARGLATDLFDDATLKKLSECDAPHAPEGVLAEAGAALVVPLPQEGRTCGALVLGPRAGGKPYAEEDVDLVRAIGQLALGAVRNSFLLDEQVQKRRMEEEMRLARSIQERLLPQTLPVLPGVDLAAEAVPSRAVGGDLYDARVMADGRLFLAVADVTGKGVPASLLMANLQACLHTLLPDPGPLEGVAARINRVICENTSSTTFITAFFCAYDPVTGALEYVNCGHNPPYLVRGDGTVEELREGGLLLGVIKSATFTPGQATLEKGDTVVLFTDGVTEALGPNNEEFMEERLVAVLQATVGMGAQERLRAIQDAVSAFTGPVSEASDDLTLVVLRSGE